MIKSAPDGSFSTPISLAANAVLHSLMYFDVFRHPLNTDEIHRNCQWHSCTLTETAAALEELQALDIVSEEEGFWFLKGNEKNIPLRIDRQDRAKHFHAKAKKYSAMIAAFPFVRSVSISGSLSKGTMDKDGDIDYFIVTVPGRLWIARTSLILFKKIFLLNSKKYMCVNYFIDTDNLMIPDHNLFVATEIAFLQPMVNKEIYAEFMARNNWYKIFYPNRDFHLRHDIDRLKSGWLKRTLEKTLNGKFGDWLDEKFLRITLNRWKRKFPNLSNENFEVDFRTRKNVSKHHPQAFQRKVSLEIEKRRQHILEETGIVIPTMQWEWTS